MNHNRYPDPWTFTHYQDMGYGRDLIIRAWTECRGNHNFLLDRIVQLSRDRYKPYSQRAPQLMTAETARLLKKLPRTYHLRLKFEGDDCLKYLELRKLGLFSKKAFRNAKALHLEYNGKQNLQDKHIETLANHMNRGLRKLKHLSVKFRFSRGLSVDIQPLLRSVKQTFVGLVSLKISLRKSFEFSASDVYSFERLFLKISSTLKFLDLDFSGNQDHNRKYFSEALGAVILKRLPRLEGLCLDFSQTGFSTWIVGLLISGASTHLTRLSRLYINLEKCQLDQVQWNSYNGRKRIPRFSSNLQDLKLNFDGCRDLSLGYLSLLQRDIVTFCPKLASLFICTLNCVRFSNGFYGSLEDEFLQKLKNLEQFRLLYSYGLEKNLERYQETQLLEMKQTMVLERKVARIKQRARGEEEVGMYLKTLIEEEKAPEIDELSEPEYLENNFENQFLVKEDFEIEIQERIESVIKNMDGMVEEAQWFLNSELPYEPYSHYYCKRCYNHDCCGWYYDNCCGLYESEDPYETEEIHMEKEQDLQDIMEEEIRFGDLTEGGKVTQIYLNYGDDI